MTVYLLGSRGPEVLKIQQQLSELQFYSGPPDGVFGGGTDSAVRAFQLSQQLQVDGKVGPGTWGALFNGADVPAPAVTKESLDRQCLALTGGLETDHPPPDVPGHGRGRTGHAAPVAERARSGSPRCEARPGHPMIRLPHDCVAGRPRDPTAPARLRH